MPILIFALNYKKSKIPHLGGITIRVILSILLEATHSAPRLQL